MTEHAFVGIEAGGTKFVCVWGSDPEHLYDRTVIRTGTPSDTMPEVFEYIRMAMGKASIRAIGAAVFGPLDLDKNSKSYGYITTTPKLAWRFYDFVGSLKKAFGLPVGFDTDVNAAALGEYRFGAARGISDFMYITVGTGIGAGCMLDGRLLHGAMHPEMGHMLIPHDRFQDPFEGVCPYHGDCFEGLASGPAMKDRWQVKSALDLPQHHQAWALEAHYLGVALANYTFMLSPKRIIMGGGVMRQDHLLPQIRTQLMTSIAGYVQNPWLEDLESYVVKPDLGENVGVCGALALAEQAFRA